MLYSKEPCSSKRTDCTLNWKLLLKSILRVVAFFHLVIVIMVGIYVCGKTQLGQSNTDTLIRSNVRRPLMFIKDQNQNNDSTRILRSMVVIKERGTEKAVPKLLFNMKKPLTAVGFVGQLGNQMFQLASAYGIAKARGSSLCTLGFDGTPLDEAVTLMPNISRCLTFNYRLAFEAGFGTHTATLQSEPGSIKVGEYLQSYKYFDEVPFQLKPRKWAERWVDQHGVSVGIHVRRGDYAAQRQNGGRPPPALYFEYCLHLLRQRHGPLRAVVVSDDPDWVRAQPVFAAAILHRGTPAEDMALLAACPHVIASIGTFGWWAMRLKTRPGESFYYADPWDYDVVPQHREAFRAADYFLPGWTGVGDAELAAFGPLVLEWGTAGPAGSER